VEAHELDKSLHSDFRRVQEMCALCYTHRLSQRLMSSNGGGDSSSDESEDEQEAAKNSSAPQSASLKQQQTSAQQQHLKQAQHQTQHQKHQEGVVSERVRKPKRRSKAFYFFKLPDKVMFKINSFLDVDSATSLFRAITVNADRSVDESRFNRWSGSSQGSASTQEGGGIRWSHGSGHASSVDGANLRWSTGTMDRALASRLTNVKL